MKKDTYLFLALALAIGSVAGSLFFSNFLKLPPCDLCWYQRIFMFPLAVILAVGFLTEDKKVHLYSLPLIGIGAVISIYHNLLYYNIITPTITPCTGGVSCTERQLDLFGFLSIPLMSLISFSILFILISIHTYQGKQNETR